MQAELKTKLLATNYFIDNKFLDLYIDLVLKNTNTRQQKFKTEKHHILQRSYFKEIGIDCDNSKTNVINLIYRDHILAHYYLCLCTLNKLNEANVCCLNYMLNYSKLTLVEKNNIINELDNYQVLHEKYRQLDSLRNTGRHLSEEHKAKISAGGKGKLRSEETRVKMRKPKSKLHAQHISEAQKGKVISQETKLKIKQAKQNIHWFNNDIKEIQASCCPKGWIAGRLKMSADQKNKLSAAHKGKTTWNKGLTKAIAKNLKGGRKKKLEN